MMHRSIAAWAVLRKGMLAGALHQLAPHASKAAFCLLLDHVRCFDVEGRGAGPIPLEHSQSQSHGLQKRQALRQVRIVHLEEHVVLCRHKNTSHAEITRLSPGTCLPKFVGR